MHHLNGHKRDNRFANLEGLSTAKHTRKHGVETWTPERRAKNTAHLNQIRQLADHFKRPYRLTELTRDWMLQVLYENNGSPTTFRDQYGYDYATIQKYLRRFDIDWRTIKRELGVRIHNHRILDIEEREAIDVYDLVIDETHNFIAGALCVHNCQNPNLQNVVADKAGPEGLASGFRRCVESRDGIPANRTAAEIEQWQNRWLVQ